MKSSFIPKEKGVLPRILMLDFNPVDVEYVRNLGYEVIEGHTGFSYEAFHIPRHCSEIEIIFWDTSLIRDDDQVTVPGSGSGKNRGWSIHNIGRDVAKANIEKIKEYFNRVSEKKGFVGVFLDDKISTPHLHLPFLLNSKFSFETRNTSTLYLNRNKEDDVWFDFYERFVRKENVYFAIDWKDNLVGFVDYFEDEDDNVHAVTYRHFAIIPKIEDKKPALTYLLQDVLPYHSKGEDIFPDKFYYRWTNLDAYLPSTVAHLRNEMKEIKQRLEAEMTAREELIERELNESDYLTNLLIADDSDLFTEDKKLSVTVHKILESDLGFKVTNVDELRLESGLSLKEDKWIEDDGYFALVEIKGTEKGAKANWVRHDLTAHIREFEITKGVTNVNSILIFNHERRCVPEDRSKPFSDDADLVAFSIKSNICLLSSYELFKLTRAVKDELITKESAREQIKKCTGIYNFSL